jgi:four helix bundle protein
MLVAWCMAKRLEELPVFHKAQDFCVAVTAILQRPALQRNRNLHKQLDEANDSIIANMREGFEMGTDASLAQYLLYAKGSLAEVRARLRRARSKGYITNEEFAAQDDRGEEIAKMLGGWIKYLDGCDFKDRGRFQGRNQAAPPRARSR